MIQQDHFVKDGFLNPHTEMEWARTESATLISS